MLYLTPVLSLSHVKAHFYCTEKFCISVRAAQEGARSESGFLVLKFAHFFLCMHGLLAIVASTHIPKAVDVSVSVSGGLCPLVV